MVKDWFYSFLFQSCSSVGAVTFDELKLVSVVQVPRLSFSRNVRKFLNLWSFQSLPGCWQENISENTRQEKVRTTTKQCMWPLSGLGLGRLWQPSALGGHSLFTFCHGHLSISMHFTPGYSLLREEIYWPQLNSRDSALGNFQGD